MDFENHEISVREDLEQEISDLQSQLVAANKHFEVLKDQYKDLLAC